MSQKHVLIAHEVNPDLIFSGEMWILDHKKSWRKKICRFDGRFLVWVKPHKFLDSLTTIPHLPSTPTNYPSHNITGNSSDKNFSFSRPSTSSALFRMTTTVSDRYYPTNDGASPALDSPMLSIPRDPFQLLVGKPGEWIDAKRRYPVFDMLDILDLDRVCVLTRSSKYPAAAPLSNNSKISAGGVVDGDVAGSSGLSFKSQPTSNDEKNKFGPMVDKVFVMKQKDGNNVFCRFKHDYEFKSWLFSIVNSLRYLRPDYGWEKQFSYDNAEHKETDNIKRSLSHLTEDNSADILPSDFESVHIESFGRVDRTEKKRERRKTLASSVLPSETEEREAIPLRGGKEPYRKMSFDGVLPIQSAGEIFPNVSNAMDTSTSSFTRKEEEDDAMNESKISSTSAFYDESITDKASIKEPEVRQNSILSADSFEQPTQDEEEIFDEFFKSRKAQKKPSETQTPRKGNTNAAQKPTVIRVNSTLYRQLSRHGVLGRFPGADGSPIDSELSPQGNCQSEEVTLMIDREMADLYQQLIEKLENSGFE